MIKKSIVILLSVVVLFFGLITVSGFYTENYGIDAIEINDYQEVALNIESTPPQEIFVEEVPSQIDNNNLLFVGNSLVEGLSVVSGDNNVYLTKVGVTLDGLKSKIYNSLQDYPCDVVVVGMGTNELGSYGESLFKSEFKDLIEQIRGINKDSIIICLSIPPVSDRKSRNDELFNNSNVALYNQYIKEIVDSENLNYIDNTKFFGDVLKSDWTGDGIHLTGSVYKYWYSFILEEISRI